MKKKLLTSALIISLGLTGCGSSVNLTEKKSDMVAEYAAGLILKYDKYYEGNLQTMAPDKEGTDSLTDGSNSNTSKGDLSTPAPQKNETINYLKLSEVLNQKNLSIKYTKYFLCKEYPKDRTNAYFTITTAKNNLFLVTEFQVKNVTNKKQNINMLKSNIEYQLDINNGAKYSPSVTLLSNDIQTIHAGLNPGESMKAVLLFEIPKDSNIKELKLFVTNNSKKSFVSMK